MDFAGKSIISVDQFDLEGIEKLFALAHRMRKIEQREVRCQILGGYILGSYFWEASTRTQASSEMAFMRLGGEVISKTGIPFSSMVKGETWADTVRVLQATCDILVVRHPEKGSAEIAAKYSKKPVINAGDGPGEHPTQALLDLFTIFEEGKQIEGSTIAMCGDLKHGRTVHSLAKLLRLYKNVRIICVAPLEIQMPIELVQQLQDAGVQVECTDSLERGIAHADVIYMTRIQKERFEDIAAYDRLNGMYVLNRRVVEQHCKPNATIMHPLPRVNELETDLDDLPGAAYFRQAENGNLIRMALYLLVLDKVRKLF